MSFSLINTYPSLFNTTLQSTFHPIDVSQVYKQIAEEFSKYYYSLYDTTFVHLSTIYPPDAKFTYLDEEIIGFPNYYEHLRHRNIYKFTHYTINVTSQPLNNKSLLLIATGIMSVNDAIYQNRFSEMIVIQRDDQNKFFVTHTIFKLCD